ncbi:MAG: type II secretion system protein [Thermoguttaceae bacterium]
MNRKRGFSLVEMIVVLTVASVLMGIAVTLLCALIRAQGTSREVVEQTVSINRLAERFRRDVHAAQEFTKETDGAHIGSVEYLVKGSTVNRSVWTGKNRTEQDAFHLGDGYTARLETVATDARRLVRLTVVPQETATMGRRSLQIEAALGFDGRFAERREEAK